MSCLSDHSRWSVPTAPRKYLVVTILAALTLQKSGYSTPRCSKLTEPSRQFVMTTSRRSHVTSSYGWTPSVVHTRCSFSPPAAPARVPRDLPVLMPSPAMLLPPRLVQIKSSWEYPHRRTRSPSAPAHRPRRPLPAPRPAAGGLPRGRGRALRAPLRTLGRQPLGLGLHVAQGGDLALERVNRV